MVIGIPALMVMLSMALPARVNRATNLVVASLQIPTQVFNGRGAWDWVFYYGLTVGIEVLILAFILRSAWAWHAAQPQCRCRTPPHHTDRRPGWGGSRGARGAVSVAQADSCRVRLEIQRNLDLARARND